MGTSKDKDYNHGYSGGSQSQSSSQKSESKSTSTSNQTSSSDGWSERVVSPEVQAAARQRFDETMANMGYMRDPNSPNGFSPDKTLYGALNVNRENLREERERQQQLNRKRKLAAAIGESGRLLSDMVSAGIGGNVWRREKDTTATDALNENKRLRELQLAEDIAAEEKERQERKAALQAATNARDAYIRDFARQTSHSEGKSEGSSSQESSSSSSSKSSSKHTGWQKTEKDTDDGTNGTNTSTTTTGGSGNVHAFQVIDPKTKHPRTYYIPNENWRDTINSTYSRLKERGYITSSLGKNPSFENIETAVRQKVSELERKGDQKWINERGWVLGTFGSTVNQPGGYVIEGYRQGGVSNNASGNDQFGGVFN